MQFLSLIPSWLKNKYFLALTFFCGWMLFFDHNDIFLQFGRHRELKDLQVRKEYYQDQIKQTQKEVESLRINTSSLEKLARERYLMKKDNEDLYVIPE
jgi:cell division protein DivIC